MQEMRGTSRDIKVWASDPSKTTARRVTDVKVSSRYRPESQSGSFVLRPRIKVWMQCQNGFGFGSRFVAILEAVDRTGSIKNAAVEVGWSYRHVWSRIKKAEAALSCTLVTTKLGGQRKDRSELTPDARQIVSRFHELRKRLLDLASRDADFANP
jgi:molybdate transport system regulatory protein